jgi:hypothetical protein
VKFPKVKTTFEMVWAEHICIESPSLNFTTVNLLSEEEHNRATTGTVALSIILPGQKN